MLYIVSIRFHASEEPLVFKFRFKPNADEFARIMAAESAEVAIKTV